MYIPRYHIIRAADIGPIIHGRADARAIAKGHAKNAGVQVYVGLSGGFYATWTDSVVCNAIGGRFDCVDWMHEHNDADEYVVGVVLEVHDADGTWWQPDRKEAGCGTTDPLAGMCDGD